MNHFLNLFVFTAVVLRGFSKKILSICNMLSDTIDCENNRRDG